MPRYSLVLVQPASLYSRPLLVRQSREQSTLSADRYNVIHAATIGIVASDVIRVGGKVEGSVGVIGMLMTMRLVVPVVHSLTAVIVVIRSICTDCSTARYDAKCPAPR